jgi:hypothetical protein
MCSINHDLKTIFVHIPKCGGLYVEKILDKFYNFKTEYFTHENHLDFIDQNGNDPMLDKLKKNGFLHITKKGVLRYFMSSTYHTEKQNITIDQWNSYTKFTIIRNPYDRIVSAWNYINNTLDQNYTFDEFLKSKDTCNRYTFFHAFISQYKQLLDLNDELKYDHYGKFENLNEEFVNVILKMGIKIQHGHLIKNNRKLNSSSKPNESVNYIGYYTDELIHIVNDLFHDDFTHLGFTKCNNMSELIEDSSKYFISDEMFNEKNDMLVSTLIENKHIEDVDLLNQLIKNDKENEEKDKKERDDEELEEKYREEIAQKEKEERKKEQERKKTKESKNKIKQTVLTANGLNIQLGQQIESACKNIMQPNTNNNMADIHFKGIVEMFRRASEETKKAHVRK